MLSQMFLSNVCVQTTWSDLLIRNTVVSNQIMNTKWEHVQMAKKKPQILETISKILSCKLFVLIAYMLNDSLNQMLRQDNKRVPKKKKNKSNRTRQRL